MNKELYDNFKKLTEPAKNDLKFKLKDSPIATRLFAFLSNGTNRNFKNRDIVAVLYREELNDSNYALLENRYFKLRKKFIEEWFTTSDVSVILLSDEETELLHCKKLILENQKEQAYQKLSRLEKSCWEKNIFELLPSIIDNLIFCSQTLNRLDRNDLLYDKQKKAIELQADCYTLIMLARKTYEINFKKGIAFAKKELNEIKELGLKHKNYPRFTMVYHHISLYYKLGSGDYLEDMQVVSRHFKQYKELNGKYPYMPLVSYRKNFDVYQHIHYKQIEVFYHYNRMEFEDSYFAMKDIWDLVHSENKIHRLFKTESTYYNMFSAQRTTERFADAAKTIDMYITFLKETNNAGKLDYACSLQAMVMASSYTKSKEKDVPYFLGKIDQYLKSINGNSNVHSTPGEILLIKVKLYYLSGKLVEAIKILKENDLMEYLKPFDLDKLFSFVISKQMDPAKLKEVRKNLQKRIITSKNPVEYVELKWLQKVMG